MSSPNTQLAPKDQLRSFLAQVAEAVSDLAGREVSPERIATLMLAEASDSKLYEIMATAAGRKSIANFFRLSTQLQLEPGKAMGLLYATPRHIKGQWQILPIIGYKGLCELARRSGQVARLNAQPFYQEELERGLLKVSIEPPDIQHRWSPESIDKSDQALIGAYAIAELRDGSRVQVILSRGDIDATRRRSPTGNKSFSPWKSDFAAMARKTALRRLLMGGLVPLSVEARSAMVREDDRRTTIDTTARVVKEPTLVDPVTKAIGMDDEGDEGERLEQDLDEEARLDEKRLKVLNEQPEQEQARPEPEPQAPQNEDADW